jgi:6-phosphofructokinase 1
MVSVKKIGILTGGGDCPGLNPAIRAVVTKAQELGYEVIGIKEGWLGLIEGLTCPLKREDVDELISKGGTLLGTSRKNPFKKKEELEKVLANIKKLALDAIVAIGGEDTLGVAARLFEEYKLPIVGVPKTMDNDLSGTDYTFGFDTSVTIAMDIAERLRDTGRSHQRVMVLEVMGRHAGWVALFTGLGCGADWILVPEEEPDLDAMCRLLKERRAQGKRYGLVVVSEGIKLPQLKVGKEELDEFGHMILKKRGVGELVAEEITKRTGIDTRVVVVGHIQRGGAPTLFDRLLATRVGVKAVELIQEGKFGQMAGFTEGKIKAVSLKEATGKLKTLTPEWLKLAKLFSQ